jgi:hypothetical protein
MFNPEVVTTNARQVKRDRKIIARSYKRSDITFDFKLVTGSYNFLAPYFTLVYAPKNGLFIGIDLLLNTNHDDIEDEVRNSWQINTQAKARKLISSMQKRLSLPFEDEVMYQSVMTDMGRLAIAHIGHKIELDNKDIIPVLYPMATILSETTSTTEGMLTFQ